MSLRLELNSVTNCELEHFHVRLHVMKKSQALDYAIVEIDQLRFGELVDVDFHLTSRCD
jgi:hypothetical protein